MIRAGSGHGILLQSIEQDTTLPPAFASLVRLTNGNRNACVVPQILLVSGSNALDRIERLDESAIHWSSEDVKKVMKELQVHPEKEEEEDMIRTITKILNTEAEHAKKITRITKQQLENFNRDDSESDTLLVCEFVPHKVVRKKNAALYVRIASIKKRDIKENYHFRVVTEKAYSEPMDINKGAKYRTSFVAWKPLLSTTVSHAVEQANVIYFNQADVNNHEARRLMIKRDTFSGISVPLPEKWGFDRNWENWIEDDSDKSTKEEDYSIEISLGIHFLERWLKKIGKKTLYTPTENKLQTIVQSYVLTKKSKAPSSHAREQSDAMVLRSIETPEDEEETREGFFEYLEPLEKDLESDVERKVPRHMASGFNYIGRLYVSECYIHRYFNVITSQGWLTESEKQVFGNNYHIGQNENLSYVRTRGSIV